MKIAALLIVSFFLLRVVAAPKNFDGKSIQDVENFIRSEGITSLQEVLPRLPQEHRANFVLMRQSSSFQRTDDPMRPRAILYGNDGELIFAFNGKGDSLEMMEKRGDAIAFARLDFVAGQPPVRQDRVCNACHGGRPLWGQYRRWGGMYGGDQEMVPSGSLEEKDYFAFLRASKSDPLYGNLVFKCGEYNNGGITPGFMPRGDASLPKCAEASDLLRGVQGAKLYRLQRRMSQPAEGMGELMNRLNAQRLLAKMRKHAKFPELRALFAANTLGCVGTRIYDYNSGDPEALARLRQTLSRETRVVENDIYARSRATGSEEATFEGQLFNLASIDVDDEIRVDGLYGTPMTLKTDCENHGAYSPNPSCSKGDGYRAYSDGSDMDTELVSYLLLRELAAEDPALKDLLTRGLEAARAHFATNPPNDNGYRDAASIVSVIDGLLADLAVPATQAAWLPKYMNTYGFSHVLRYGDAAGICRRLLAKR